jgi:glycerol-3-phosphate dehydrogenase
MSEPFDIAVIGAGVVGCAVARELSRYDLACIVLEANPDFGDEASKGNSALLCTGYDTPHGTLERRLVMRGYARYQAEAPALGLPVRRTGAVALAWDAAQAERLLVEHAEVLADGFDVTLMEATAIYARWPHFGPGAQLGLWAPDECIVDPFSTPFAYLLEAVANGVTYRHATPVTAAEHVAGRWHLATPTGPVEARLVVNCGGLRADRVEALAGYDEIRLRPRRGQYLLYDKPAHALLKVIAAPVATAQSRGILLAPTIFGNVLVGPTAEDVEDRDDRRVTTEGIERLRAAADRVLPGLAAHAVTTSFAGMRPATDRLDYRIIPRLDRGWLTVAGIRSTGLSAALGIAEHAVELLAPALPRLKRKGGTVQVRVPSLSAWDARPCTDAARVAADPAYGEVVCHCEQVSVGEIRDALASPLPPRSLKALRRRTRAMFGRCQGFFCGARVQAMFDAAHRHAA